MITEDIEDEGDFADATGDPVETTIMSTLNLEVVAG
jgi:hypothetical protein